MIDCPEPICSHNYDLASKFGNDLQSRGPRSQWRQQATRAFDEERHWAEMKIFPDVLNVIQNVSQLDPTAVFTGSNQWSNRFGEIKWINLVDAQVAILK